MHLALLLTILLEAAALFGLGYGIVFLLDRWDTRRRRARLAEAETAGRADRRA